MGFLDDFFDPDRMSAAGGLPGLLLSSLPQANAPQSSTATDPQNLPPGNSPQLPTPADVGSAQTPPTTPDFGVRLGAGLQGWAQTPAGSPFAALANGINAFSGAQPASTAGASSSAPPASTSVQTPNLGDRLGAALQSWALTPVGSPFAALANGVTGFNTGQTSVAPTTAKPAQTQPSGNSDQATSATQNQTAPAANAAANPPVRRLVVMRRWR